MSITFDEDARLIATVVVAALALIVSFSSLLYSRRSYRLAAQTFERLRPSLELSLSFVQYDSEAKRWKNYGGRYISSGQYLVLRNWLEAKKLYALRVQWENPSGSTFYLREAEWTIATILPTLEEVKALDIEFTYKTFEVEELLPAKVESYASGVAYLELKTVFGAFELPPGARLIADVATTPQCVVSPASLIIDGKAFKTDTVRGIWLTETLDLYQATHARDRASPAVLDGTSRSGLNWKKSTWRSGLKARFLRLRVRSVKYSSSGSSTKQYKFFIRI